MRMESLASIVEKARRDALANLVYTSNILASAVLLIPHLIRPRVIT